MAPLFRRRAGASASASAAAAPTAAASSCSGRAGAAPAPRWMIFASFAILAILAAVLVYQVIVRNQRDARDARQRPEGFYSSAADEQPQAVLPKQQLVFLYMTGCGWCDRFKPQWEAFDDLYGETLGRRGVVLLSYERSDPAARQYQSHVDGYPTVLLVSEGGGRVVKFEGDRTPEGLMAFVTKHSGPLSEGFESEARTEFAAINSKIKEARDAQKDRYNDQQQSMQSNAGGKLEGFSCW